MICIGIALVFWLLVKLSQQYSVERPLVFRFDIPEDKALTNAPPEDMTVRVEGTGWDLMFGYFSSPEVVLYYDLRQTSRFDLSRAQLRSDIARQLYQNDTRVAELNFDDLSFTLEKKISKRVPVILKSALSFDREYYLARPVALDPDSVTITGPASLLNRLRSWPTDSLRLSRLKSTQSRLLALVEAPREIQLSTKEVSVNIEVEQYTEKSLFVPLTVENAPARDSIRFFPLRIRVTFIVGLSHYNEIDTSDFKLVADMKGVDAAHEKGRKQVEIQLVKKPDFVRSIQFSPQLAEFFIVKR